MSRLRMLPLLAALALSTGVALTACDKGGNQDKGEKKADDGEKADADKDTEAPAEAGEAEAGAEEAGGEPAESGEPAAEAGEPTAETGADETGDEEGEEGDEGEDGSEDGGEDAGEDGGEDGGDKQPANDPNDGKKDPEPKKDPAPKKDPSPKADKANGKELYLKKCKSCHAPDGSGKTKLGEKYEIESLKNTKLSNAKIVSILVKGIPDTKMKSYKGKLSDQEMQDVAAFVKSL